RSQHLSDYQRTVLDDGTDSRYRQRARGCERLAKDVLHRARDGMAGHRSPVAALLNGVLTIGGTSYSAGAFGAFGGVVGFRDGATAGLAQYDLRAILRRRRNFFRRRDGCHAFDSDAPNARHPGPVDRVA